MLFFVKLVVNLKFKVKLTLFKLMPSIKVFFIAEEH